ncbi:amidohydrolase [uncultured Jatrophihabitans sp.]|uniref:amidohydrolase n=1 Tax=uncultured Jatrophihabitans sp. TaxID=1610747 RepID=UPI0035CC96CD
MPTLYRNAVLHAVPQPTLRPATAFLVADGRIGWLGDDPAADRLDVGADTAVVDLQTSLVTPAFVDAHVHCTATGLALTGLDLRECPSGADVVRKVGERVRTARGRPVLGSGWDETRWPDGRPPTINELDRASYGGAVYLSRVDEHSALVSSSLLAAVPGIRDLPGFAPDGWLRGTAHEAARTAALAGITGEQRRTAQLAALRRAAALGIACVHEMAGPVVSSADDLLELLALAADETLPDVVGYWGELFGIDTARELGAVGAAGDLFCDGSLGSHTAALHEPYADAPGEYGNLQHDTGDLVEHVVRCTEAGMQAGFHAIGDAAVDQVLTAVETAQQRVGPAAQRVRHRLEHAEYVRDPRRFAATGLIASVQPCFDALWGGGDRMYAQRLGAERAGALNRFAELAAAGVPLAFGSDSPVTELGPWAAVRAATRPRGPVAPLDADQAFAAHTVGARAAADSDAGPARLQVGAPATFAVWQCAGRDATLPDLTGDELPTCLATVSGGSTLYDTGVLGG